MVETSLQAPGAGLPSFEAFVIRSIIMPVATRIMTWDMADEKFRRETDKALKLYKSIPVEKRSEQVLIPKIWGIEDSSRHWSADMTLEHMIIVAKATQKAIQSLDQENNPNYVIDIAKVKPKNALHENSAEVFTQTMQNTLDAMIRITNRNSEASLYHPWLGNMNTQGLHTMLAFHQGIHRRQLETIIKALKLGK